VARTVILGSDLFGTQGQLGAGREWNCAGRTIKLALCRRSAGQASQVVHA